MAYSNFVQTQILTVGITSAYFFGKENCPVIKTNKQKKTTKTTTKKDQQPKPKPPPTKTAHEQTKNHTNNYKKFEDSSRLGQQTCFSITSCHAKVCKECKRWDTQQ